MYNRKSRAFTMMELLVVIAIIGAIAAFVDPRAAKWMGKIGETQIKFNFTTIKEALTEYKLDLDMYPTNKEGLEALVTNPRPNDDRFKRFNHKWPRVKDEEIRDKQGNPFIYHCPPEKFKGKYKQYELIYEGPNPEENLDDGV